MGKDDNDDNDESTEVAIPESARSPSKPIPKNIEDMLFFMYCNGLPARDIVSRFKDSNTPFTVVQFQNLVRLRGWFEKRRMLQSEISTEFSDLIKHSQVKKMAAISMAVHAVSDMVIQDVTDFREDPKKFWQEVNERKRSKPFWLAKNVEDLMNLYKLQKYLQDGTDGSETKGALSEQERSVLLAALGESQRLKMQPSSVVVNVVQPVSPQIQEATTVEVIDQEEPLKALFEEGPLKVLNAGCDSLKDL